jgi:membrane-associated phospholipid phosphatase
MKAAWLPALLLCVLPLSASAQSISPAPSTPAAVAAPTDDASPASRAIEEDTSFVSLFTKVPPAFLRLGRPDSLAILAAGGGAAALVVAEDGDISRSAARSTRLGDNFSAGHVLGDGYVQGALALGTYVTGRLAHSREVTLLGAHLVRAQLLSGFITDVTKAIAQRDRPNGGRYSFPSGHTSSAFATAAVLQRHYGWKVGIPAYALGTYVGVSRLADNKHYPSDLIVGAAIGVASARAVTVQYRRHQFAATPLLAPGGGGIALTLVN